MKLLVITQKIDSQDPVLGFMHRWLAELSRCTGPFRAICLAKGAVQLPEVTIASLGKECGANRVTRLFRFFRTIIAWWSSYDTVFVHMNQVYVLLAAPLWRIGGKRVFLWRNHPTGTFATRLAVALCNGVFYTSPQSYTARFRHAQRMPVGIDTDLFSTGGSVPTPRSILILGRLDPVKRLDIIADALCTLQSRNVPFSASFVGDPSPGNEAYSETIRARLTKCGVRTLWSGSVPQSGVVHQYRTHALVVNATPSGSMDKTMLEALACGCGLVTCNAAMTDLLPPQMLFTENDTSSLSHALEMLLEHGVPDGLRVELRAKVVEQHSLGVLMDQLVPALNRRP